MNPKDALRLLSARRDEICRRFGVGELAIFGSVARGEARPDSDLDVLVAFEGRPDFDRFMGLKLYLEELFGGRDDLVTERALRPEMRPQVDREAIHVP